MEVTQRILQERCGLTLRFHSTPALLCPDTAESGSISNADSTMVINLGAARLTGQGEGSRIVSQDAVTYPPLLVHAVIINVDKFL